MASGDNIPSSHLHQHVAVPPACHKPEYAESAGTERHLPVSGNHQEDNINRPDMHRHLHRHLLDAGGIHSDRHHQLLSQQLLHRQEAGLFVMDADT